MTRKQNSQRRGNAYRQPTPMVLVLCGAEKTEPQYLNGIRREYRNMSVRVTVKDKVLDPASLVRHAARARDYDGFDEAWCVVDVDDFDLASAAEAASELNVHLAVSNPCFEYWLLLHFKQCATPIRNYDQVVAKLREFVPRYEKNNLIFGDYSEGVADAIARAEARCPKGHRGHESNPSSGLWVLVKSMTEPASG